MSDLPPVTFGIKVTKDIGHVHFDLFAGRTPASRGRAGSLVMRPDEFEEFLERVRPEAYFKALPGEPNKPECVCDLHDIGGFGPPKYIRGLSNGCQVHPASAGEQRMVAEREAIERARDEADRVAREEARRAE